METLRNQALSPLLRPVGRSVAHKAGSPVRSANKFKVFEHVSCGTALFLSHVSLRMRKIACNGCSVDHAARFERVCVRAGCLNVSNLEWRVRMRSQAGWSTTCHKKEQRFTSKKRSPFRFRAGFDGVGMQAKLLELFAQGDSGQPQPARGLCLIAFCQRDGLREDFAFGFGDHPGMGVV